MGTSHVFSDCHYEQPQGPEQGVPLLSVLLDLGSVLNHWRPKPACPVCIPGHAVMNCFQRWPLFSLEQPQSSRKQNYDSNKGAGTLSWSPCANTWALSFFYLSFHRTFNKHLLVPKTVLLSWGVNSRKDRYAETAFRVYSKKALIGVIQVIRERHRWLWTQTKGFRKMSSKEWLEGGV